MSNIKLSESWLKIVGDEFGKDYMKALKIFLLDEKQQGKTVFPKGDAIFNALNLTPFEEVKVVILGQDPYHGLGQAHGLCFSVPREVTFPPSLKNMFIELKRDLGVINSVHGCLEDWAHQGVLLLNSVLTVEMGKAGAHQGKGWEMFTDEVIKKISELKKNVVFLLWGSYAFKKGSVINEAQHLILKSPHPSPLSAYRGFMGNGHFGLANAYLAQQGISPINWQLN